MRAANIICRFRFWYNWQITTALRPIICSAGQITPHRLRRSAHCAPGGCPLPPSGREVPLRAAGGQEGGHLRFSPSCQSTPFPSGRAARAKVSDAFQLPPGCYGRVSGTSATPRGALGWQSCPPCCKGRLGGRRKASPTFTREARPEGGGGDSQEEGEPRVPPPSCARCGRAGRIPAS